MSLDRRRSSRHLVAVAALAALGLVAPVRAHAAHGRAVRIRVLSSRPDLVTGGDALVELSSPRAAPLRALTVLAGSRDVTAAFRSGPDGTLLGLVDGLPLGSTRLAVWANRSARAPPSATLELVNHPIAGPVISGPHQVPYVCELAAFGLEPDPAADPADCAARTRVDWFYRSSATNTFQPLDPAAPRPADVATTTTSEGDTVPFVVRREMGTINRAVYLIAFLSEPGEPLPDPWTRSRAWNGRLVYSYGGGVRAGYHQGRSVGGMNAALFHLDESQVGYHEYLLARGYAVAAGSQNVFGTNASDLVSAETMMMVKERFIERFGVPVYTIGAGGSGGSMQQHMISDNYPGLLDGIVPGRSYPDTMTFLVPLFDCELLVHAFATSALPWSDAQKTAVSGYANFNYCTTNGTAYPNLRAKNCDPVALTPAMIYDPVTNPGGARCTYQDNMVNVYGVDPATGFARRAFDNVGVQYGLAALNAGVIGFDQFADLNARIGGHDIDGNVVAARTVGDPVALRTAYRTGRINEADGGLADVPIVDLRSFLDGTGNVHDAHHSKVMRARLLAANGTAANQAILTVPSTGTLGGDLNTPGSALQAVTRDVLDAMDRWLAAIAADRRPGTRAEKVVRNRPAELADGCYDAALHKITDPAECARLYPYASNPRIAAGEGWTSDRLKCALKPVDPADYAQPLTGDQLAQLRAVFPEGVCDWSRRGIGQQPLESTWLSYPSPGVAVPLDGGDSR